MMTRNLVIKDVVIFLLFMSEHTTDKYIIKLSTYAGNLDESYMVWVK